MAKKKTTNLAAALHQASGKDLHVVEHKKEDPVSVEFKQENTRIPLAPSRNGKKVISGYFDPAVSQQLKRLAIDRNTTSQALMAEALNDFFEKYHLKPIAK